MTIIKPQSFGGIAQGKILRAQSIKLYNASPNMCLLCKEPIPVRDGERVAEVRRRKFCTRSHAASFNNVGRCRVPKKVHLCLGCGSTIRLGSKLCKLCCGSKLHTTSKGELFARRKNWQSARSSIRRHAALVYAASGLPMQCAFCKYDRHVDIAHLRPVSSFPDSATIVEINALSNLIPLCPNHHWEHDHGMAGL